MGIEINACMYTYLYAHAESGKTTVDYLRPKLEANANWLRDLVKADHRSKGWWKLQAPWIDRSYLRKLKGLPLLMKIKKLPFALLGTLFDSTARYVANRKMKSRTCGIGYW